MLQTGDADAEKLVEILWESMMAFHHPKLVAQHLAEKREPLLKAVLKRPSRDRAEGGSGVSRSGAVSLLALLLVAACRAPAPTAAEAARSAPSHATSPPSRPVRVGDRIDAITTPLPIPAPGAKLTMVNYFASWCANSKRWLPHVEAMRKKHAEAGLAVVGVANVDDASQADLEAFVSGADATFPVTADKEHRIWNAIPPRGWGQEIVLVDAKGVVRLVHRGTYEGVFEEIDAEVSRLLGE